MPTLVATVATVAMAATIDNHRYPCLVNSVGGQVNTATPTHNTLVGLQATTAQALGISASNINLAIEATHHLAKDADLTEQVRTTKTTTRPTMTMRIVTWKRAIIPQHHVAGGAEIIQTGTMTSGTKTRMNMKIMTKKTTVISTMSSMTRMFMILSGMTTEGTGLADKPMVVAHTSGHSALFFFL